MERGILGLSGIALSLVLFGGTCAAADPAPPAEKKTAPETNAAKWQALADQGDLSAMADLGWAYCKGEDGVSVDQARGFALFKRAADRHFVRAEHYLGVAYEFGWGGPVDQAQAFNWYREAAEAHFPDAERVMGWVYKGGKFGQPVDKAASRMWYEKAARNNNSLSMDMMGSFWLYGTGGPKDWEKAFVWYERAAEAGEKGDADNLAYFYEHGGGTIPQSAERAWLWGFIGTFRGFPKEDDALRSFRRLRDVAAKLSAEQMGETARKGLDYIQALRQGECILNPELTGKMEVAFGTEPENEIEVDNGYLVVPVMIGQKGPFRFLLDTGASASVIGRPLAESLHLPPVGVHADIGREETVSQVVEADYTVLGNEVRHAAFLENSCLAEISRVSGKNVDGILGYDFLHHFTIRIDYAAKTIGLFDPDKFRPDPAFEIVPIFLQGGCLSVSVTLNVLNHAPITQDLVIDTGDSTITVNRAFDREYDFSRLVPKAFPGKDMTFWGINRTSEGRLQSLTLGSFQMVLPIADCDEAFMPQESPWGTLGASILKRFQTVIDYKNKKLYLRKGPAFDEPEVGTWSGLLVWTGKDDSKALEVFEVLDASPAADGGFKVGDIIVACDRISERALTLSKLHELVRKEGDHVLAVRRGDALLTLGLKPIPF